MKTEHYAGLTTADKGALIKLKESGVKVTTIISLRQSANTSLKSNYDNINIDLALAQIEEMEKAQKAVQDYLTSDHKTTTPLTNRDKWMQLWNESDEILARQFVQQEWYGTQWCVYMFGEEPISRHDKWEDAIQAAITELRSPYTEGDADEG